ncbi:hypothetical protein DXG01_001457 [Tephrocybe rancida]|nr:hypothetical protein DXG01_001457 [Tephrocybe rancida]
MSGFHCTSSITWLLMPYIYVEDNDLGVLLSDLSQAPPTPPIAALIGRLHAELEADAQQDDIDAGEISGHGSFHNEWLLSPLTNDDNYPSQSYSSPIFQGSSPLPATITLSPMVVASSPNIISHNYDYDYPQFDKYMDDIDDKLPPVSSPPPMSSSCLSTTFSRASSPDLNSLGSTSHKCPTHTRASSMEDSTHVIKRLRNGELLSDSELITA